MMPLAFPSSLALQVSDELANVPATRVENACASGSAALQQGVKSLLAGTAKTVLVIGAEKMTHAGADVVGAALMGADYDKARAPRRRPGSPACSPRSPKAYEKRYGPVGDALGTIAAKNHHNGMANPYAHLHKDFGEEFCRTVSDKNPMVADPLRRTDCSPVSDGAAALIITTQPGSGARTDPVRLAGFGQANDFMPAARRDPTAFAAVAGLLAAGAGDGRGDAGGAGLPRGARLLHHRRAADVRGAGDHRRRPGRAGARGGLGVQGRQAAGERVRRAEVRRGIRWAPPASRST